MPQRLKAIRKQELYMAFALCAISDFLLDEVLEEAPFAQTRWRQFGFSEQTLALLRAEIARHKKCFQEIHAYLNARSACPDPPCPSEEWIGDVCEVALNTNAVRAKSARRK